MSVLEYLGPFTAKTGETSGQTKVRCRCDWCGDEWQSTIRTLKRFKHTLGLGAICRVCMVSGPPQTLEQVMQMHPRIIGVQSAKGMRNGNIISASKLIARCDDCGKEYAVKYGNIPVSGKTWRCASCRSRSSKKQPLLYPWDVPALMAWDEMTLGDVGQLSEKTVVTYRCEECDDLTTTRWGYYRNGGVNTGRRVCRYCGPFIRHTEATRREQSRRMRQLWQTPEGREKFITGRIVGNYSTTLSRPHAKLKSLIVKAGVTGFESERWVAKGMRADEVDYVHKRVIEFYGDYFHANPTKYVPDAVLKFPDGSRIAQDIWRRDAQRLKRLDALGYRTLVVWEAEFRRNPAEVVAHIVRWTSG